MRLRSVQAPASTWTAARSPLGKIAAWQDGRLARWKPSTRVAPSPATFRGTADGLQRVRLAATGPDAGRGCGYPPRCQLQPSTAASHWPEIWLRPKRSCSILHFASRCMTVLARLTRSQENGAMTMRLTIRSKRKSRLTKRKEIVSSMPFSLANWPPDVQALYRRGLVGGSCFWRI